MPEALRTDIDFAIDSDPPERREPWTLAVRPASFTVCLEQTTRHEVYPAAFTRSYSVGEGDWSQHDVDSITEVIVRPYIMYPVSLCLRRHEGSFAGKYGEDGTGVILLALVR